MNKIILTGDLRRAGYSTDEIDQMVRSGAMTRVRRGAYQSGPQADEVDRRIAHHRMVVGTVAQTGPGLVISHMSAAVIHGLPLFASQLDRVQFIRPGAGGGTTRSLVRIHGLPLEADDIVLVDGLAVTSLARTVLDLACQLPMDQAVAIGDAGLRFGVRKVDLAAMLERAGRRNGIGAARRAIGFLDARAETVGESRSRVMFHHHRVPAPDLQFYIYDADGRFVARSDFGWEALLTVGEFDGQVKYQRKLREGHDPEQELFLEKRREDAVRDLRFEMVRWINLDIDQPSDLLSRLQRAFERGRRHL